MQMLIDSYTCPAHFPLIVQSALTLLCCRTCADSGTEQSREGGYLLETNTTRYIFTHIALFLHYGRNIYMRVLFSGYLGTKMA